MIGFIIVLYYSTTNLREPSPITTSYTFGDFFRLNSQIFIIPFSLLLIFQLRQPIQDLPLSRQSHYRDLDQFYCRYN